MNNSWLLTANVWCFTKMVKDFFSVTFILLCHDAWNTSCLCNQVEVQIIRCSSKPGFILTNFYVIISVFNFLYLPPRALGDNSVVSILAADPSRRWTVTYFHIYVYVCWVGGLASNINSTLYLPHDKRCVDKSLIFCWLFCRLEFTAQFHFFDCKYWRFRYILHILQTLAVIQASRMFHYDILKLIKLKYLLKLSLNMLLGLDIRYWCYISRYRLLVNSWTLWQSEFSAFVQNVTVNIMPWKN